MKKCGKYIVAVSLTAAMCMNLNPAFAAVDAPKIHVTEENAVPGLTMDGQPESSYWFPEQLLSWDAKTDSDLPHNISHVPLATRVAADKLQPVNDTQNRDTKVMAISIMNASTSGNAPHGLNEIDCNTFSYWQYVDLLVYWGGSSGEGLIVPPSPDVADAGHKNGVPVLGTVFFPQDVAGGKVEWLDTFLKQDSNGKFLMVDKLVEVAQTYGFDGWFINQETDNQKNGGLSSEYAAKMQAFIQQFKQKAPELELVWYDSMTKTGAMDWQNALTDENLMFLQDAKGKPVADDMFLNFWWTDEKYASKKLLESSENLAKQKGLDPYDLFAGVDVQAKGYETPIRWDLFEKDAGGTHTSLGLYCPSWAYTSATDQQDFLNKETTLWVNDKADPSAEITYDSPQEWRGVSRYVVERSAITSTPFVTNFSLGNGASFFRQGQEISKLDWNNRSLSDVLPTYRFMMAHEGNNKLTATFDSEQAWYGGNSLKLAGSMEAGKASKITLYSADLPLTKDTVWTTTAKASQATALKLIVTLEDGTEQVIAADKQIGTDWTTVRFDVSKLAGKRVQRIAYSMSTSKQANPYTFHFGNVSVYEAKQIQNAKVSQLKVDDKTFDEDSMYAGVRLSWKIEGSAPYYEVYRINADKSRSLLGVSNTNSFYINTLPRTDDTNKSEFMVVPVDFTQGQGVGTTVQMEWPNNSLPKAGFQASKTLAAPGETITFTSTSSVNTKEVAWELPGASKTTATGDSVSVTYSKPGTYDVTIRVKNSAGADEKTIKGCIVIDSAANTLKNLSQGKTVTASSFVNENEAPKFAVDGDSKKKWCATGTPPHELTIDLGSVNRVSEVVIQHAQAGGEGADMNTKAYRILVSEDGKNYQEVVNVTRNAQGQTKDTFAPVKARYVKLDITKPTQGSDTAARIYEVQVFGLPQ